MTLHISEAEVRQVLTMPMALEAVEGISRKQATGEVLVHPRRRGNVIEYTLVDLDYEFPRYPVPEGETMDSFLRKRTEEGFQNRYGAKRNEELFERAQKQVQRESAMLFIV